jgi:hypothetical protein
VQQSETAVSDKTKVGNPVRGVSGQMAIFVALLFQILFVFFAMIINVGLLVHDKINLQNAVDLGAIYAAQRQAETLNMIAHTNYQIRQSWKLMTWRLRVLGDIARQGHPGGELSGGSQGGEEFDSSLGSPGNEKGPAVCIWHKLWKESSDRAGSTQDLCKKAADIRIPKIPKAKQIAGFLPWTGAVVGLVDRMRSVFEGQCKAAGPASWLYGSLIYIRFKRDQEYRRTLLRLLADFLSADASSWKDLNNDSVEVGVRKTILKNLTRSNKARIKDSDIVLFNSLGGVKPEDWLPEIAIQALIPYVDFIENGGACNGNLKFVNPGVTNDPNGHLPYHGINNLDRNGEVAGQVGDPLPGSPFRPNLEYPSIGVEKNPWWLAYVGVKVDIKPSTQFVLPFAPLGKAIGMTAKAFAQPFGGRVGPWFKQFWIASENQSSGEKTDGLLPDRAGVGIPMAPGTDDIPNYSKYPGDRLGLKSRMALSAMSREFYKVRGRQLSFFQSYSGLGDKVQGNPERDALAWAKGSPVTPWIREFEVAAVAPDLFDVTYYSIDPNFWFTYLQSSPIGTTDNLAIWGDMGSHAPPGLPAFSVEEQINFSGRLYGDSVSYIVKDWRTLLTGWAQPGAVTYDFPTQKFGKCAMQDKEGQGKGLTIPGSCLSGGRTGYSVKIVSKQYLEGPIELGGPGNSGKIKNPPPEKF